MTGDDNDDGIHNPTALDRIKLVVGRGDIRYSTHAKKRMRQRGAQPADVINAEGAPDLGLP